MMVLINIILRLRTVLDESNSAAAVEANAVAASWCCAGIACKVRVLNTSSPLGGGAKNPCNSGSSGPVSKI